MTKYIWQSKTWPQFSWSDSEILNALAMARKKQGQILGQAKFLALKEQAEILINETVATSAIEGEKLDRNSVRSSVAKRLGLPTAGLPEAARQTDGLVEMLLDATTSYSKELNQERLWGWQAALFPTGHSGINKIQVGNWRVGDEPMQVISGPMGKAIIHYEAPGSNEVPAEMKKFLKWWNKEEKLDGILRAAIAHFWFVTIHPFEDGNGRVARALTDMALAQDEKVSMRLYSLSSQIVKERDAYYSVLEETQKGKGDITKWLLWFLEMFSRSIDASNGMIEKALWMGKYFDQTAALDLNDRQKKVIRKMLETWPEEFVGGLTTKKYVSMTKASSATVKRDIEDLVLKKVLLQNEGKGRSTSYRLNKDII